LNLEQLKLMKLNLYAIKGLTIPTIHHSIVI